METNEMKARILQALKKGEYEISICEPNNVWIHEHPDGSKYYVLTGDSARFGTNLGSCTIKVCGLSATCELELGGWSGDDVLFRDREILDAIKKLKGMFTGIQTGTYEQMEVYAAAKGLNINDLEFYCCEDEDIPVDASDIVDLEGCKLYSVTYDDEELYLVTEPEPCEGGCWAYACYSDAEVDNYGKYPCVALFFDTEEVVDGQVAVRMDDDQCLMYNPDTGEVE